MKRRTLKKQLRRYVKWVTQDENYHVERRGAIVTAEEYILHDEGYSFIGWVFDFDTFEVSVVHDGSDCDGRSSRNKVSVFCGAKMRTFTEWNGRKVKRLVARWQKLSDRVRDYSAERAGY